jgi:hypothetical protein
MGKDALKKQTGLVFLVLHQGPHNSSVTPTCQHLFHKILPTKDMPGSLTGTFGNLDVTSGAPYFIDQM